MDIVDIVNETYMKVHHRDTEAVFVTARSPFDKLRSDEAVHPSTLRLRRRLRMRRR
jgi:hypothetical protein